MWAWQSVKPIYNRSVDTSVKPEVKNGKRQKPGFVHIGLSGEPVLLHTSCYELCVPTWSDFVRYFDQATSNGRKSKPVVSNGCLMPCIMASLHIWMWNSHFKIIYWTTCENGAYGEYIASCSWLFMENLYHQHATLAGQVMHARKNTICLIYDKWHVMSRNMAMHCHLVITFLFSRLRCPMLNLKVKYERVG